MQIVGRLGWALLALTLSLPCWGGDLNAVLKEGWQRPPSPYPYIYGYSEYTPPYFQGVRPYEKFLDTPEKLKASEAFSEFYDPADPGHYQVSLYEEERELAPGFEYLAKHLMDDLFELARGDSPGGDTLRGIPA